jgi:hypothetical protein
MMPEWEMSGEISVDAAGETIVVPPEAGSFLIVNDSNGASDRVHVGFNVNLSDLGTTGLSQLPIEKDEWMQSVINPAEAISFISFKSGGAAVTVRFIFA